MRILLCIALAAVVVQAQDARKRAQLEEELDRLREIGFEQRDGLGLSEHVRLDYGVYTTFSMLGVDDVTTGRTRLLRQTDAKAWVDASSGGHRFYGRLRLRYRDFNNGESFDGAGDDLTEPIGDRYWYRFDWRADRRSEGGDDPSWNWTAQIGRQYVSIGSGLALSETLYAARLHARGACWRFEAFGALTPSTGTIDIDASRPHYTSDTDRRFWGALVELTGWMLARPYVYVIDQSDENDDVLANGVRYGYDSMYVGIGSTGQFTGAVLYRLEYITVSGDSVSDTFTVPQTIEDIDAWAGRLEVIFMPRRGRDGLRPRFEMELIVGSGDKDRAHSTQARGGNTSGTSDRSFIGFGYARTGLVLAPEPANLAAARLGASFFPLHDRALFGEMRVGIDVYLFTKRDENAPVSVTTRAATWMGVEADFVLDWQVHSDVHLQLRYGIFVPADAFADHQPRHFGYFGVSYGF